MSTVELVGGPGDGTVMAFPGSPGSTVCTAVPRPIRWSDCLADPAAEPPYDTIVYERDLALTWRYVWRRGQ